MTSHLYGDKKEKIVFIFKTPLDSSFPELILSKIYYATIKQERIEKR